MIVTLQAKVTIAVALHEGFLSIKEKSQ